MINFIVDNVTQHSTPKPSSQQLSKSVEKSSISASALPPRYRRKTVSAEEIKIIEVMLLTLELIM